MNYLRLVQRCGVRISVIRNSSTITIPALTDSYPIEATIFEPISPSSTNSICVVISEATGVRRQLYFPFAEYLSKEHNLHVITYDYRGIHEKKATPWTLVEHWARRDCAGVLSYSFKNYNQVVHLGHSLGGDMHALLPSPINEQISRIILLSSVNSYLMYCKWLGLLQALLDFISFVNHLFGLYGYYPMHTLLRTGVDTPANIIRQWARWSLYRECFVDDNGKMFAEGFNSVKCPVLALNFADDEYYTRQAFDIFTKQFHRSSNIQNHHLPKGGHFHFFKQEQSAELWGKVTRFIKYGDNISFDFI